LLFKAINDKSEQTGLFSEAYRLTVKYHLIDEMNLVEYIRAGYFTARKQYDSAMLHILRYRDNTETEMHGEGYRNILNLQGDVYYHAGVYSMAYDVYFDLLRLYEQEKNWNFYRPYVMMNNLGQIAFNVGDLEEARKWFERSLKTAERYLHTNYRNNTLAYTKIKLAETFLNSNNLEVAGRLIGNVDSLPAMDIQEDVRQEWKFVKARLLLKQGYPEMAKEMAFNLLPDSLLIFNAYKFVPDIYQLIAETYSSLGDYEAALGFSRRFNKIKDSLQVQEHLAASMIILADYNHELTRIELKQSRQRVHLLALGLGVFFVVILIILMLYRKLYRSKLELVRKSIETNASVDLPPEENVSDTVAPNGEDDKLQKEIIVALKDLMIKEKPFLISGIGIQEVAKQLSTNRTYLSKAINSQLKTTFPNFINQYRIRESIRLITSGYMQHRTQETLARKSGFANRTVFINAFKKYTGVLPSFFVDNYAKWDPKEKNFHEDDQHYPA